jgi:endonuclease/exonuclease/phosphatase (EEP) superfamily protein YafD
VLKGRRTEIFVPRRWTGKKLTLKRPTTSKRHRRSMIAVTLHAACSGALVIAGGALLLRQTSPTSRWAAALISFTPYTVLLAVPATAAMALQRRWLTATVGSLISVGLAATQVPLYVSNSSAPAGSRDLVVMSCNLHFGAADADALVRTARELHADVLMVQELTPQAVARLRGAGLEELMPFSVLAPGATATGAGLWSRYPLDRAPAPPGLTFTPVAARVAVRGVPLRSHPLVLSVHPVAPWPSGVRLWRSDLAQLRTWLSRRDGQVLVAGDFNATLDHRQLRSILGVGYRDAAEQVGAGLVRTYPAGRRIPPFVGIDHVLIRGGPVATAFETRAVAGSDHRAIAATIALPPRT